MIGGNTGPRSGGSIIGSGEGNFLSLTQIHALTERLRPWRNHIGGIWGQPGTGKTCVPACEAVQAIIEYCERVLVCAFENATVDQTIRNIIFVLKTTYGCTKEQFKD